MCKRWYELTKWEYGTRRIDTPLLRHDASITKGSTVPLYVRAYLRSRFIEFLAWGICCMVHKVKPIPWKNFETARLLLLLLLLLLWSWFSLDQSFYVILIKDFMLVMHCFRISELHIPILSPQYYTNGRVKCSILTMYLTGLPVAY